MPDDEFEEVSTDAGEDEGKSSKDEGLADDLFGKDVTIEGLDFLADDEEGKKKGDGKEKPSKKVDGLEGIDVNALNTRISQLESDKNNLKKALHEERQSKKKSPAGDSGGEDAVLSDSQLLKIMEEYKDDNATILNVIKYQAERSAKQAGKKAVEDVEIINRKKEADQFLVTMYPDLEKDDSDIRIAVNQTKDRFGVQDHPLGDLFATGVQVLLHLDQIKKASFEEGKKETLGESAEKGRKQNIAGSGVIVKGKGSPGPGEKPGGGMTEGHLETAKKLGFKPGTRQYETFKRIVGGQADRITVEA